MKTSFQNPFRLSLAEQIKAKPLQMIATHAERTTERVLGLTPLIEQYEYLRNPASSPAEFAESILTAFNTSWDIVRGDLSRIPKEGPVMVVANHPFGCIEGVLLIHLLAQVRPDARLLANYLLNRIPELADAFVSVDPFDQAGAASRNIRGLSKAISWLKDGGLLGVFPSGTVSHLSLKRMDISDPTWSETAARMAKRTGATVVPIYFHGRNSTLFQLAGLLHPNLRTALLIREFRRSVRKPISLSIGAPIPAGRLQEFDCDLEATEYLRLRTHIMAAGNQKQKPATHAAPQQKMAAIIDPIPPADIEQEIRELPKNRLLLKDGSFELYYGRASEIPSTLQEIGRLRETTFRQTNEGTGNAIDLDVYDNFYVHLFMWNTAKRRLVGAYRLAHTDEVLARYGRKGLYTYSLFSYSTELLKQMGPSLEMGRSFVVKQHQRDYAALSRLWQGIGHYVAAHPQYRILFGPVSISNDYNAISRKLIIEFLRHNCYTVELAREVQPRTPMPKFRLRGVGPEQVRTVRTLSDVAELLQEIETKHENVPVLLRQYLRLGAKTIGYNLDPSFSNVLDALLYVDLAHTEPKLLYRYFGKENAERFLAMHGTADRKNTQAP